VIAPGATWSPSWQVEQPAATLWYHAHPANRTGAQVYRGAAGMFILEDPATDPAALPHRYGVDDIPLIIQDRRFDDDGQFRFDSPRFSPIGVLGDEILVNGTHDPYLQVSTERVRLRVLNASNARTYNLGLSDDRAFTVIAGDGGYLATPQRMDRLVVAPSERFEIVLDLRPGDAVIVRSYPTRVGGGRLPVRFAGGDDTFDLVRLVAADRLQSSPPLPNRLPAPQPTAAPNDATRREFTFNHASRINGGHYDHDRIDFTMPAGEIEAWELDNTSDNQHVFHVHGVSFTVTAIDGRPPPAHLSGPKDSIFLPPGTTATIAVRAPRWADATLPYMFHCHVLAHEDHGMMGQFTVTDG
jgi:FtsP/CotA-like multicopper oxidase with cupredoxin domain